MIPLPNQGNEYAATVTQPTNWRQELIRVDHNLSDNERLTFRYIHDSWDTLNPNPLWTNQGSFPTIQTQFTGPGLALVTRLASTPSPSLLNEFVFSYTTDHIGLTNVGNYKRLPGSTFGAIFPGADRGVLPGINLVDQGTAYGGGSFGQDPGYIPNGPYNSNPTYTYRDNINKIIGTHSLQFGAYFVAGQKNELGGELGAGSFPGYLTFDPSSSSTTTHNPVADMLLGYIASFGQQNATVKYYNRYKILEPFAVTERASFEFRVEAFNIFNHTQWGAIAGDAGSGAGNNSSGTNVLTGSASDDTGAGALQPSIVHSPRILQFGLKFLF